MLFTEVIGFQVFIVVAVAVLVIIWFLHNLVGLLWRNVLFPSLG